MDNLGVFTYDASLPTPRDRMRHMLGDFDATNPLRYDESYDAMLVYFENETLATAKMARALASEYAQKPSSVSVQGGPTVSWSERVKTWLDLATRLEAAVGSGADGVTAGYSDSMLTRATTSRGEYRRRPMEELIGKIW